MSWQWDCRAGWQARSAGQWYSQVRPEHGSSCGGRLSQPPPAAPPPMPVRSVRLPKNSATGHGVVLGEGKPENQNAAVIFCFGEVVQVGQGMGAPCA